MPHKAENRHAYIKLTILFEILLFRYLSLCLQVNITINMQNSEAATFLKKT